jgi:hypothetical protein
MKSIVKLVLLTALITTVWNVSVWAKDEKPTSSSNVEALHHPLRVISETEDEKPSASANVGIFTKYIWRGYELSDESIVIQPSATIGYKGFSFNLWGNLDTDVDDATHDNQFNETDWTLSYATSSGPISFDMGYIYYGLDAIDDSEELYLSIGIDTILSPSVTIYREISHLPSWYVSLGISHSVELSKGITLDMAGSIGAYYSDDDSFTEFNSTDKYRDFHNGLFSIGLTIPLDKYFTISPTIAYSFGLTNEADDVISNTNLYSNDSDYFCGGVTVSLAF